jgi:hypothetical protein
MIVRSDKMGKVDYGYFLVPSASSPNRLTNKNKQESTSHGKERQFAFREIRFKERACVFPPRLVATELHSARWPAPGIGRSGIRADLSILHAILLLHHRQV